MANLYGRLFKYRTRERRAPLEDFLSEAVADLWQRMPRAMAIECVGHMLKRDPVAVEAWRQHARTAKEFDWQTQRAIREGQQGIIDILLEVDGLPALIIENKIGSAVRAHSEGRNEVNSSRVTDSNQLATYGRWLDGKCAGKWSGALILLTHTSGPPDDFLADGGGRYGVPFRAVASWAEFVRWLRQQLSDGANRESGEAWQMLATDLISFLEEQDMTAETISSADLAALQLYLPSANRLSATFRQIWSATEPVRREVCTSRPSDVRYDGAGAVAWSWNYTKQPPAPPSSYIGFGIRFPLHSNWWRGQDLTMQPQAFLTVGDDNGTLPISGLQAIPNGWQNIENELVTEAPLHSFRPGADELVLDLSVWAENRMREAVTLIKEMSAP